MELPDDDQPPEAIWLNDEKITDHFARLAEKRKTGSSQEAVPAAPLEQNEITKGLRKS